MAERPGNVEDERFEDVNDDEVAGIENDEELEDDELDDEDADDADEVED